MSNSDSIGKQEMKRLTKAKIVEDFTAKGGFVAVERSAGAVNYVALKPSEDSQFVIASVYGDRRGAASVWIKDECFEILQVITKAGFKTSVVYLGLGYSITLLLLLWTKWGVNQTS